MHNLDQTIAEWRKNMSRTRGLGPDTLDELESHLRETIHTLVESGTPEQEAVQQAIAQLGTVVEVSAEFQKLSPATWQPVRIVTVIAGALLLLRLACGVVLPQLRPWDALLAAHVHVLILGYVAGVLLGVLLGVLGICFVIQRSFAEFSTRRTETLRRAVCLYTTWAFALTLMGVILGMVYSQREWGRLWGWSPREIGGLCVAAWHAGILGVQRFRWTGVRSLMVASLAGSSIVLLAVFGPELLSWRVLRYGPDLLPSWPLLLVLAVHALFLFAGLAPAGWLRVRRGVVS